MSQLKKQLRMIIARLGKEANKLSDPEARSRWMKLRSISESPKTLASACRFYGASEDWYRKWGLRLKKNPRIEILSSKSKRPHRSPRKTKAHIEKKVLKLRRAEPSHGPERISYDMKMVFELVVPSSTVYAILKRAKLVAKSLAERLTKKHLKRYRRPLPGFLQMDFKYVPYPIDGAQLYQLSCVDHHSSWRLIKIYRRKSTESVLQFLNLLEEVCPFPIMEIQTDNDAAFTDLFTSQQGVTGTHPMDLWCYARGIRHKLIPVGQKELNGKVENTHKQDDREFYAKGPYRSYENISLNIEGYNQRWNEHRRTKALGFKSPQEVIKAAYIKATAFLILCQPNPNHASYRLDRQGNAYLPIVPPKAKKKIRTRKPTAVEKYLRYLEWESKNKLRALIASAPTISQSFS